MVYIIVGIAGILGALSRYYLGISIGLFWHHPFPLATLFINLVGCFLLGWITTYISRLKLLPAEIVTGIGTGFVGAFTTFSTFSVETVTFINHSEWTFAIVYVVCSVLGGLFMSGLGYKLGDISYEKRTQKQPFSLSKGGTKQ
ncbi:fluoride efflux transporter CrcB [Bacillus sp. C1]